MRILKVLTGFCRFWEDLIQDPILGAVKNQNLKLVIFLEDPYWPGPTSKDFQSSQTRLIIE